MQYDKISFPKQYLAEDTFNKVSDIPRVESKLMYTLHNTNCLQHDATTINIIAPNSIHAGYISQRDLFFDASVYIKYY